MAQRLFCSFSGLRACHVAHQAGFRGMPVASLELSRGCDTSEASCDAEAAARGLLRLEQEPELGSQDAQ